MKYLLLALPFALLSCHLSLSPKEDPPIEPKKMEQILLDLHMAEVYSSLTHDSVQLVSVKNMDSLAAYHTDILAHHNISQQEFGDVVQWYREHAPQLDSLYARILPRLSEMEMRYK